MCEWVKSNSPPQTSRNIGGIFVACLRRQERGWIIVTDTRESDMVKRKIAADAMGVSVRDVRIIKGIPEYRPDWEPKLKSRPKRRKKITGLKLP